jgi:hypothetical protein
MASRSPIHDQNSRRALVVRSRLRLLFLIVAVSALSCARSDRVTAPGASAHASRNVLDALISRASSAASQGDLSAQEASLVIGNATLVLFRL